MKSRNIIHLAIFGIAICASPVSSAADIFKADNTTSLITGSSWLGGTPPGTADTALFDASYAQSGTLATGGPLSWGGIKVTTFSSGANPINIDNITTTHHVGIGPGGIDMSAAERGLRVFAAQAQADQSWNITSGITSTVNDTNRNLNLGGGTLGATADWSSDLALTFIGTGGNTTIDTLDAIDATTPRTITLAGSSGGSGGFVKSGTDTLVIEGTFAHQGDSQVADGTMELASTGMLFNAATGGIQTISGVISGSGTIQHLGAGEFVLAAVNTQTGPVIVDSGVLRLNPGAKLYQTGAFFGVQNQNYITINAGGAFETWNWNFGDANALSRLRHNYGQILLNGGTIRFTESFSSSRAFTVGASGGTLETGSGTIFTKMPGTTAEDNIIHFTNNSTLTLFFGVFQQASGTWGSTASSATHKDDTRFVTWADVPLSHPGLVNTSGSLSYTLPSGAGRIFVRLSVIPD